MINILFCLFVCDLYDVLATALFVVWLLVTISTRSSWLINLNNMKFLVAMIVFTRGFLRRNVYSLIFINSLTCVLSSDRLECDSTF